MFALRKARWFWPVFATILLADCSTKELIVSALGTSPGPHQIIGNLFRVTLAYNPDAAMNLSFGSGSRLIFGTIALLALAALFRMYQRTRADAALRAVALALVAGGALGNLLDRLRSPRGVVDFIDLGVGDARFWTFNLADLGVTVGALLLALVLWREDLTHRPTCSRWFGLAALLTALQAQPGHISRAGVVRAQAVVDSVFLDRKLVEGTIEGGDWASYLMARLGVEPLPENTEILIAIDSQHIALSGRIQDLPAEARAMIGPLAALVDSSTVLAAEIDLLPAAPGLSHFRLEGVSIGGFPVPELILRSMLLDVGEHYPALTKSGRDLFVEIPQEGKVSLISGAVRLSMPSVPRAPSPPSKARGR